MAEFKVVYKCRLCGETYNYSGGEIVRDVKAANRVASAACVRKNAEIQPYAMATVHSYADGNVGIADLQGCRKV